jgi:hypothetical protein
MRARYLAIAAAAWAVAYAGSYAVTIGGQGNPVAWWYAALPAAGAAALACAAAGRWPRPMSIFGAAVLGCAALAGVLSIGALLIPGVVAAALAGAPPGDRDRVPGQADRRTT